MTTPDALGRRCWLIPDGYLPSGEADGFDSHEAVCVLNTSDEDARVTLRFYFEDRPPLGPVTVDVPGERTQHVRVDALELPEEGAIPRDVPYAIRIDSDVPITVQHSRMDVRSPNMALMTTMAVPGE